MNTKPLCGLPAAQPVHNHRISYPQHLNKLELSEAFRLNYMADLKRIPPVYVNDGPIFQNVMKGNDVDISVFPTPMWHPEDGGR